MNFFSSDAHWYHAKAIIHSNRPTTPETQTQWLIDQYNSRVSPGDDMWFLGDFAFTKSVEDLVYILSRVNGNWKMIPGNHDKHKNEPYCVTLETAINQCNEEFGTNHQLMSDYVERKFYLLGRTFMMHYPIEQWNSAHYGSTHLHGHLHGTAITNRQNRFDVGIDNHPEFLPWSEEELAKAIKAKNALPDCVINKHH